MGACWFNKHLRSLQENWINTKTKSNKGGLCFCLL